MISISLTYDDDGASVEVFCNGKVWPIARGFAMHIPGISRENTACRAIRDARREMSAARKAKR